MARHLLIAGIDFGTSFTKVVLRDKNAPGSNAVVVRFPHHADGLLPSIVKLDGHQLFAPHPSATGATVPYLKMLAAHVANGESIAASHIQTPPALLASRDSQPDAAIVRELLALFLAHVIAATEEFIRTQSPWRDFDFTPHSQKDILIFQLAVPTGLMAKHGETEKLFCEAFIAGYELRRAVAPDMAKPHARSAWSDAVARVLAEDGESLAKRFQWQCLLYPEVAAAVQTVFRRPNAADGLYITMDVGAGTVDLNAFNRFSGQQFPTAQRTTHRALDYYAAIVAPLGVQNLNDPHGAVKSRVENELMAELREEVIALFRRALPFQRNNRDELGRRTWDQATLFIFGGGAHHRGYRHHYAAALEHAGIHAPQVLNLPSAQDLALPRNVDFGRFAVAYGLSFFRHDLDEVRLPHELKTFAELYPEAAEELPRQYGFNWDD